MCYSNTKANLTLLQEQVTLCFFSKQSITRHKFYNLFWLKWIKFFTSVKKSLSFATYLPSSSTNKVESYNRQLIYYKLLIHPQVIVHSFVDFGGGGWGWDMIPQNKTLSQHILTRKIEALQNCNYSLSMCLCINLLAFWFYACLPCISVPHISAGLTL